MGGSVLCALGVLVLLGAGCYQPGASATCLECSASQLCPAGQTCDGTLCRPIGAPDSCEAPASGSEDASIDAQRADAAGCDVDTFQADILADGILVGGSTQPKGELSVANIGVGIDSVGVFRFDAAALPASRDLQAIRLILTYAARADDCQEGCGSCDGIDQAGQLVLHYMRSDWDEATAHDTQRAAGQPWGEVGASAIGVDRSDPIGTAAHADNASTALDVEASALTGFDLWLQSGSISFLVAPTDGAVMVSATRETSASGCAAFAAPALEIDYCD